jgi:hypothetical protein
MSERGGRSSFNAQAQVGWEAALLEIEHQAEHWDTPDHGQVGHLIAEALRAATDIARAGGLHCRHRGGSADVPEGVQYDLDGTRAQAPQNLSEAQPSPPAA